MEIMLPEEIERGIRSLLLYATTVMIVVMAATAMLWPGDRFELLNYVDIPLHLFGGLGVSISFLVLLHAMHGQHVVSDIPYWLRAIAVMGFTGLVTIAWEFLEHFADTYLGTNLQSTVIETLKDMAVGLAGALPVALWSTRDALGQRR